MRTLLKNATIFRDKQFEKTDLLMEDGLIISIFPNLPIDDTVDSVFFLDGTYLAPSFCDLHVHFREPGYSYKETICDGARAAARGGFTTVCAMPNLDPAPDCMEHLQQELDIIARDACIEVIPYGTITRGRTGEGELADMAGMAEQVCAFTDDGTGVQQQADMEQAMRLAKSLNAIITAHCEDMRLVPKGGCCSDGLLEEKYGVIGIPAESEWGQIRRDIDIVRETGCRYHICHLSSAESVQAVREAKAEGLPVTCEVTPHNLALCDEDILNEGRFKMNPPIRSRENRAALVEGFLDGTIDIMATDHAPHSAEEKSKGLAGSVMGVVGLETAFAVLNTHLVRTGKMSLEALLDRMSRTPREIFNLPFSPIAEGQRLNAVVLDIDKQFTVNPQDFLTKGRATPFEGDKLYGEIAATWYNGDLVYTREGFHEG